MGPRKIIQRLLKRRQPAEELLAIVEEEDFDTIEMWWAIGTAVATVIAIAVVIFFIGEPPKEEKDNKKADSSLSRSLVASAEGDSSATPQYWASIASSVASQSWEDIGSLHEESFEKMVDKITSILCMRIVACQPSSAVLLENLCTSTISQHNFHSWPGVTSAVVVKELRVYVSEIVGRYRATLPYHTTLHAYHVFMTAQALLEQILQNDTVPSFGIRKDTLAHFALLFAALVHDVDHEGVPNRQLVLEHSKTALRFNDVSVAEQHSLVVAFELLHEERFQNLQKSIASTEEEYQRFRKMVIQLVLCTDIADPDKTQTFLVKWKQAFGDVKEKNEDINEPWSPFTSDEEVSSVDGMPPTERKKVSTKKSGRRSGRKKLLAKSMMVQGSVEFQPDSGFVEEIEAFRKNLGICRSLDLTGEFIESYRSGELLGSLHSDDDPADELKALVVLQVLMTAADVGQNFQGWDSMIEWSDRLYREVELAHKLGRGPAPARWYENQMGFLESYVLPLTRRLHGMHVLPESFTRQCCRIVKENRDRWHQQGRQVAKKICNGTIKS